MNDVFPEWDNADQVIKEVVKQSPIIMVSIYEEEAIINFCGSSILYAHTPEELRDRMADRVRLFWNNVLSQEAKSRIDAVIINFLNKPHTNGDLEISAQKLSDQLVRIMNDFEASALDYYSLKDEFKKALGVRCE